MGAVRKSFQIFYRLLLMLRGQLEQLWLNCVRKIREINIFSWNVRWTLILNTGEPIRPRHRLVFLKIPPDLSTRRLEQSSHTCHYYFFIGSHSVWTTRANPTYWVKLQITMHLKEFHSQVVDLRPLQDLEEVVITTATEKRLDTRGRNKTRGSVFSCNHRVFFF